MIGQGVTSFRGRRWIHVGVLAASLLGVAAIAGAAPGEYSPTLSASSRMDAAEVSPTVSPSPSVEPSTSATPEPSVAPSPSPSETSDDAGNSNHGTFVSQVAHCVPGGPDHGKAVSEMARTHENEAEKANELCARYGSTESKASENEDNDDESSSPSDRKKEKKPKDSNGSNGRGRGRQGR